jgi:hypothetical protein
VARRRRSAARSLQRSTNSPLTGRGAWNSSA